MPAVGLLRVAMLWSALSVLSSGPLLADRGGGGDGGQGDVRQSAQTPPAAASFPEDIAAPAGPQDVVRSAATTTIRFVLGFLAVILLLYLVLHKGLGSLNRRIGQGRLIKIVERIGLEPKKAIYLIEVGGRYLLLGSSEQGLSLLIELEGERGATAFRDKLRNGEVTAGAHQEGPAQQGGSNG